MKFEIIHPNMGRVSSVLAPILALSDRYSHIYLSPHLDDALLSCGGSIAAHALRGERTLIVTACTAEPPPEVEEHALVRRLHAWWGLSGAAAVRARLREDEAAATLIGADVLHLGFLDAIYRNLHEYTDRSVLFGPVLTEDRLPHELGLAMSSIVARCPGALLHAPLGVGGHVDHKIAHLAVAEIPRPVSYYEDFPYVTRAGALEERLDALGGADAWAHSARPVNATLRLRIEAARCYASQVAMLFGDEESMARMIDRYARAVAPPGAVHGEREWLRRSGGPGVTHPA